jgi:hypothetical protein
MRYLSWILLLLGLMTVFYAAPVQACSGVPSTFDYYLSVSDVIVRGQLIESDELQQNYILKVNTYLSRTAGSEYLLVSQNNPLIIQGIIDSNIGGEDCNVLRRSLPKYEEGFFLLKRQASGAYWLNDAFFPTADTITYVFYDGTTRDYVTQSVSTAEFAASILELLGTRVRDPLPNSRYPATAPLVIVTENGTKYLLPVDRRSPVQLTGALQVRYLREQFYHFDPWDDAKCGFIDCYSMSPDGRTFIRRSDFMFWIDYKYSEFERGDFLLSSIGMALWNADTLTIYVVHDTVRLSLGLLHQLRQITIKPNEKSGSAFSVWSRDGHLLAFSDAEGLWLWDVFTPDTMPRLLLPAEHDIPVALEFSGKNRYLAVQRGEAKFILDLLMDTRLPFGYISPDESLMVMCVDVEIFRESACRLQLWQLAPFANPAGWWSYVKKDIQMQWVHDRHLIIKACYVETGICGISDADMYETQEDANWGVYLNFELKPGRDFAVQGRNVAILVDDNTLRVNWETLNMELDSPIAGMYWLPSLFYGENPVPAVHH